MVISIYPDYFKQKEKLNQKHSSFGARNGARVLTTKVAKQFHPGVM